MNPPTRGNTSSHPAVKVIGTTTVWEQWVALKNLDLSQSCNWVELRLDAMPSSISVEEILEYRPFRPLIVTARDPQEGGVRQLSVTTRLSLLEESLSQAAAIDIEIANMPQARSLIETAHKTSVQIVASYHNFEQTPTAEELCEQEKIARDLGADIVKFAVRHHTPDDLIVGTTVLARRTGPVAIMGMGPLGPTSRLLYSQCGSCLLYGYLGLYEGAPGQWPAQSFFNAISKLQIVPLNQ